MNLEYACFFFEYEYPLQRGTNPYKMFNQWHIFVMETFDWGVVKSEIETAHTKIEMKIFGM